MPVVSQMLCAEQPAKVIALYASNRYIWEKFFARSQDERVLKWFAHFNLDGRAKLGALALEHYAFTHRYDKLVTVVVH